jgi:hypothetical protein
MGYYVEIVSCDIEKPIYINEHDLYVEYGGWCVDDNKILPCERYVKFTDEFIESIKYLVKLGCSGFLELEGETGEREKYVLDPESGQVNVFEGTVVYSEEPTYVL